MADIRCGAQLHGSRAAEPGWSDAVLARAAAPTSVYRCGACARIETAEVVAALAADAAARDQAGAQLGLAPGEAAQLGLSLDGLKALGKVAGKPVNVPGPPSGVR